MAEARALLRPTLFPTNVGFVDFDRLALAANTAAIARYRCHGLTNAMGHEPCRLVGDPKLAMQLVSAETLFRRRIEAKAQSPLGQRDMAGLHDAARSHRER